MRLCHSLALISLVLMILWVAACSGTSPTVAAHDSSATVKIAPALLNAVQQLHSGTSLPANGPVRNDAQGRIQIYVYVSNTLPETVSALAAQGLQGTEVSPEMNIVQGWINPSALVNLAALPFVTRITPPRYAQPR